MKITSEQLRFIIKEEIDRVLEDISRREFCKIAGTTAAGLAVGCQDYDLSDVDLDKPEGFPSCVQGVYFQPGSNVAEWEGGYPMDRFLAQFTNQEYTIVTEDANADAFGFRNYSAPEVTIVQFHNVPEFSKSWEETLGLPSDFVASKYELSDGSYAYLSTVTIAFPRAATGSEERIFMNEQQYAFEINNDDWGLGWAEKSKPFDLVVDQDAYTGTGGTNPGSTPGDLRACRDAFKRYDDKTDAEYTTDPEFLPENKRFI